MQRFLSTATLSLLTAIAIVSYSSDSSVPVAQDVAPKMLNPTGPNVVGSSFYEAITGPRAWIKDNLAETTQSSQLVNPMVESTGKSDPLDLAPLQFSNCDVGQWSRTVSLDELPR